jgi:sarcosine oxidase delta subunit
MILHREMSLSLTVHYSEYLYCRSKHSYSMYLQNLWWEYSVGLNTYMGSVRDTIYRVHSTAMLMCMSVRAEQS